LRWKWRKKMCIEKDRKRKDRERKIEIEKIEKER
jgi:hypothetical protein